MLQMQPKTDCPWRQWGRKKLYHRSLRSQQNNQFNEATMGAAFLTKRQLYPLITKLFDFIYPFHIQQIWDTVGQEKYRSIAHLYFRQAKIAICVYDICSVRSFEALKKWVRELHYNRPKDIMLVIVGNKIDKIDDQQVPYSKAKAYAESIGAMLKLVNAKQRKNIIELINEVALKLYEQGGVNNKKGFVKMKKEKQKHRKRC